MVQLDEHWKEKVEVLDEVGGARLEPTWYDAQKPKRWQAAVAAGVGVLRSRHAGVVLVDPGVLWKGGAGGGGEGRGQEVEEGVANGVQQFENECVTRG